jgi:dipeptidyl aminopeptidase/acylaminoacyl peptidase
MRLQGKRELSFSPDGKWLSYLVTAQARRGGRTVSATELHLARYDGTGARRVIGDPYDPRHARWSPDGSRIAFDVRPPNGPNLRHIAVVEVEGERVRFFPSKTEEGTPSDTNPFWAPAGATLVHDRAIAGKVEKVLRTLALDLSAVQTEPRVLMSGSPLGTVWGWLDESEIVVVSDQWVRLLTTDGTTIYEAPGRKALLGVAPVRP